MYFEEGEVVGYKYEVLYDSFMIHEENDVFDTEDEAYEDAKLYIDQKVIDWKCEDAWHPEEGDSRGLFDVVVREVIA